MRSALLTLIALITAGLASGCSKNCQNTCTRIYAESECHVVIPGITAENMQRECESACENALTKAGEMGPYNPYNKPNPENPPELTNERQAAAWMDCVWDVECPELDPETGGVCAPI